MWPRKRDMCIPAVDGNNPWELGMQTGIQISNMPDTALCGRQSCTPCRLLLLVGFRIQPIRNVMITWSKLLLRLGCPESILGPEVSILKNFSSTLYEKRSQCTFQLCFPVDNKPTVPSACGRMDTRAGQKRKVLALARHPTAVFWSAAGQKSL